MARHYGGADCLTYASFSPIVAYPFAISVWGRMDSIGAQRNLMAFDAGSNAYDIILFVTAAGAPSLFAERTGSGTTTSVAATVVANQWFNITASLLSATSRTVWYNGVGKATSAVNRLFGGSPTNVHVGSDYGGAGSGLAHVGDIDSAAIWNSGLTDAEAYAIGQGYPLDSIRPESLKFHVRDLGRSSVERDLVGGLRPTITLTKPSPDAEITHYLRRLASRIPLVAAEGILPPVGLSPFLARQQVNVIYRM